MGNLEKLLTWVLVIVFIGFLFTWNYKSIEEASSDTDPFSLLPESEVVEKMHQQEYSQKELILEMCRVYDFSPEECQLFFEQKFIIDLNGDTLIFAEDLSEEIKAEEESLNVDSILDAVLENINMEGGTDTVKEK